MLKSFERVLGVSPYRYVKRLRLRRALHEIGEGCDDLTALALRVGFSSHSHFTAAFRAEFGVTPSAARSGLGVPPARSSASRAAAEVRAAARRRARRR